MATDGVLTLDPENFDAEVLKSTVPVMVDFWATWCGPCQQLAPVIDEIAAEKSGSAKIGKVNADDHQALVAQFGVRGLPTLLFFKDGEVKDQLIGAHPKATIIAKLDALA